jgi:hypothetical protein
MYSHDLMNTVDSPTRITTYSKVISGPDYNEQGIYSISMAVVLGF